MDRFEMTFRSVEAGLAAMHRIKSDKRTPFASRLKNFARLGVPLDMKTEKGKATLYGPKEIFELVIAVELTQLGLSPETVAQLFRSSHSGLINAIRETAWDKVEGGRYPTMLYFDPRALEDMMDFLSREEIQTTMLPSTFYFSGVDGLARSLTKKDRFSAARRLLVVNLSVLLEETLKHVVTLAAEAEEAHPELIKSFTTNLAETAEEAYQERRRELREFVRREFPDWDHEADEFLPERLHRVEQAEPEERSPDHVQIPNSFFDRIIRAWKAGR